MEWNIGFIKTNSRAHFTQVGTEIPSLLTAGRF